MSIHNYEVKYQTAMREVQEAEISLKNKELILTFVNDLVLEGLSKPRLHFMTMSPKRTLAMMAGRVFPLSASLSLYCLLWGHKEEKNQT